MLADPKVKGEWLQLPADGRPWMHPATELQFPSQLGDFKLTAAFRDKHQQDGVALTYAHKESELKADIVIFPCGADLKGVADVLALTHVHVENLANDLVALSKERGYSQKTRSAVSDQQVPLWQKGEIPMSSITLDMVPTEALQEKVLPPLNQWLGLLIYQDHFIQISVVMPSNQIVLLRKDADALITQILTCVRFPALIPELLKLCDQYLAKPLTDEGRRAADSLLVMSKDSPVFEVMLPGEALTPMLDEVNNRSPESALDLLRGFIAGSSRVILRYGSADEALEEGAKVMLETWKVLKESGKPVQSDFLVQLSKAHEAKRTAGFLKEKMNKATGPN